MATIYEKTPGALVATPGRTVATFPSGLCRVDQKYICATAHAAAHRATLAVGNDMPDGNTAPAIDGLKIFPAPQEVERGDGFTEFVVSAYGRTSREMNNIELVRKTVSPQVFLSSVSFWEIKGKIALPYGEVLNFDDLNLDPALLLPIDAVYYGTDRSVLSVTPGSSYTFYKTQPNGESRLATSRVYTIAFTSDGVNPTNNWVVSIEDPIFTVVGQQNFGSFIEVDVLTTRANTNELTTL